MSLSSYLVVTAAVGNIDGIGLGDYIDNPAPSRTGIHDLLFSPHKFLQFCIGGFAGLLRESSYL